MFIGYIGWLFENQIRKQWLNQNISQFSCGFQISKGEEPFREVEIRFLIGKQCSILLLFALVLCVQKLEKLHNGTFLANWANPTWFQKDSQFDCFIVTFRVLHVSILYIFLLFSPSLVPFIMLWGLKLFRNNNHIIVEKSWKCDNYSDHFNLTRKIQVNSLHCFYYYFFYHFSMAIKSDFVVTWPIKMWAWTTACINLCTRFGTPNQMQCWKLQPKPKTETWRDTIQNISYITSTATASFVHFYLKGL